MHIDPLGRLRLAFFAIGIVLLAPLGWLLHSVEQRLEAQRRLRHEVVAERIFDELERELTRVMDDEAARPSAAYDQPMQPASFAPFVLGYFSGQDERGIAAASELDPDRRKRIAWALSRLPASARGAIEQPPTEKPQAPLGANASPRKPSSFEVLQKLNRAKEYRQSAPPPANPPVDTLGY